MQPAVRGRAALFLTLACAWICPAETLRFSGHLRAGEAFEHRLPRGLLFCLLPGGEQSWSISIARTCLDRDADFASIATPPYHGPNPLQIDAWHFLPDARQFSNTREFRFVLNQLDHARILGLLQNRNQQDAGEILRLVEELGKGAGTVEITGVEIVPGKDPADAKFVRMRFRAAIRIPSEK